MVKVKEREDFFMASKLLQEAKQFQDELVSWRRELHQIPELGTILPQTVRFAASKLDEMGIGYQIMEDCSCIVAQIGKGILLHRSTAVCMAAVMISMRPSCWGQQSC